MPATTTRPSRPVLVARAQALRSDGLLIREIADELGISRSYAADLLLDPDRSKMIARRKRYQGVCEGCGGPTDGSSGRDLAPRFCHSCAADGYRRWTRETIVDAIKRWARLHGRPPRSIIDWAHVDAENNYPPATSVYGPDRPFASWADAIEAAGFPRPRVGKRDGQIHWDGPDDVVAFIRQHSKAGVAPSSRDFPSAARAAQRFFGSWGAACEAAGVAARVRVPEIWTREHVLDEIRRLTLYGLPPTTREHYVLAKTAWRHFGSFSAAVRAAGFEPYQSARDPRLRRRKAILARRAARRSASRSTAAAPSA